MPLHFLAQQRPDSPVSSWAPVVLLVVIGIGFAFANIALSLWIGPRRTGPGKETAYESGIERASCKVDSQISSVKEMLCHV